MFEGEQVSHQGSGYSIRVLGMKFSLGRRKVTFRQDTVGILGRILVKEHMQCKTGLIEYDVF